MQHIRPPVLFPTLAVLLAVLLMGATTRSARAQQLFWTEEGFNSGSVNLRDKNNFGFATTIYDLNDDGVLDLFIGAPWYDTTQLPRGGVYAAWGPVSSETAKDLVIDGYDDPGSTNLVGGWRTGYALAGVDGFFTGNPRLLLVGVPGFDYTSPFRAEVGRADLYVSAGGTSVTRVAHLLPPSVSASGEVGSTVTSLGDFADSSFTDIAIGSEARGEVYVYLGQSVTEDLYPSVVYAGAAADHFARGVYGGADLGGTSRPDLVISADHYGADAGRLYVYFGTDHPGSAYDADDADVVITGDSGDFLGAEVTAGADVTGDGHADLVTTLGSDDVLLVFAGPLASGSLDAGDATAVVTGWYTTAEGSHRALSTGSDLSGDGVNDIVLGVYADQGFGIVIQGGSHLSGSLTTTDLGILASKVGEPPHTGGDVPAKLGWSVAVGDVDDDGDADIALGAPKNPWPGSGAVDQPGDAYLYHYVHGVYREKGAAAATEGLDYTGTPTSGIAFAYNDTFGTRFIFVTRPSDPALLYRTGGVQLGTAVSSLRNITSAEEGEGFVSDDDIPTTGMRSAAAADYDNDGGVDFYVTAPAGTDPDEGARLYRYHPEARQFRDMADSVLVGQSSLKAAVQNGSGVSWADYDADGLADLLLTQMMDGSTAHEPVLLRNRVSEKLGFENVMATQGAGLRRSGLPGVDGRTHAWGDVDNDGDLDLFIGDERFGSQEPRLYYNLRPDSLAFVDSGTPASLAGISSATWADVDNDGNEDLVLGLTVSPGIRLVQNDGVTFTSWTPPASTTSLGVLPLDYDNDGRTELLTLPEDESSNLTLASVVVKADGTLNFRNLSSAAGVGGPGPVGFALTEDLAGAVLDNGTLYRDGDLDVVLGVTVPNGGPVPGNLFLQDLPAFSDTLTANVGAKDHTATYHWIGIVLKGGGGNNAAGIGARVQCTYTDPVRGDITQTAYVDGGSMRGSQRSQITRFGLGTRTAAVQIDVTWPDGNEQSETLGTDTIHVIEDDSQGGAPSSESFYYQPQLDGSINLVFQWNTAGPSNRELSGVRFKSTTTNQSDPCYFSESDVTGIRGDVQYTMTPVYTAQGFSHFHHTLIWNRECIPACAYEYKALAKTEYTTAQLSGTWKRINVSVCAQ